MKWAISPRGVGKEVGARAISVDDQGKDWPLSGDEVFIANEWREGMRLAAGGRALRPETVPERNARENPPAPTPAQAARKRYEGDPEWRAIVKELAAIQGITPKQMRARLESKAAGEI